jgi:hypothetical protein
MKQEGTGQAYAVCHNRLIYHIAVLFPLGDRTLCDLAALCSKNGVQYQEEGWAGSGYPTPQVVRELPQGKRLCKRCAKILAETEAGQ